MTQFSFDPNFNRTINSIETNRSLTINQLSPTLTQPDYKLISEGRNQHYGSTVVGGNTHSHTPLAEAYFSAKNLERVQKLTQLEVYKRSNGKYNIGRQSDQEMMIAMRGAYFLDGNFMDTGIKEQVDFLNKRVVRDVSERILSSIQQYVLYVRDSSTLPMPLDRGAYESTAGSRVLPPLLR